MISNSTLQQREELLTITLAASISIFLWGVVAYIVTDIVPAQYRIPTSVLIGGLVTFFHCLVMVIFTENNIEGHAISSNLDLFERTLMVFCLAWIGGVYDIIFMVIQKIIAVLKVFKILLDVVIVIFVFTFICCQSMHIYEPYEE